MTQVHILAIDLAKRSFQVCGTDRGGAVLFNRALSRARLQQLLRKRTIAIRHDRFKLKPIGRVQENANGLGHKPRLAYSNKNVNPMIVSVHSRMIFAAEGRNSGRALLQR